jgi:hypothetical protein
VEAQAAVSLLATLAAAALAPLPAQDLPENAPENCPYCGGEPELMAAAGVVSHGGFEFAKTDTRGVDAMLPEADIHWIETAHFETGFALGPHKVEQDEKKALRVELARLAEVLPKVKPKTKVLDPWLRAHLYAQRFEELYERFLGLMQVSQDVFPSGETVWLIGTPYWGEGPHLGQKSKFEGLILPSDAQQVYFLRDQFGLNVKHTQKWNVLERDALIFVTNPTMDEIRGDQQLWNHLAFTQIHNMVDAYKHYSYETPLWIKEGLAHHVERSIHPRYNSYSFQEGGLFDEIHDEDWQKEVVKLVKKDAAPRMAELASLRSFADYEADHHLVCWAVVTYLVEEHPDGFAKLNDLLHGLKGPDGMPDGSNMSEKQRKALREALGMSYAELDRAWREWVLAR